MFQSDFKESSRKIFFIFNKKICSFVQRHLRYFHDLSSPMAFFCFVRNLWFENRRSPSIIEYLKQHRKGSVFSTGDPSLTYSCCHCLLMTTAMNDGSTMMMENITPPHPNSSYNDINALQSNQCQFDHSPAFYG